MHRVSRRRAGTGLSALVLAAVFAASNSAGAGASTSKHHATHHTGRHEVRIAFTARPAGSTSSTSVAISWRAHGASNVRCSLDHGRSAPCTSPAVISNLSEGRHVFSVTASRPEATKTVQAAWRVSRKRVQPKPVPRAPAPVPAPTPAPPTTTTPTPSPSPSPSPSPAPPAPPTSGGGSGAGGGTTTSNVVAPPAAPASYALPAGAVSVTTSAGLVAALSGSTPQVIALA